MPFQLARAMGRFGLWNVLRIIPGLSWLVILLVSFQIAPVSPETLAFAFLAFLGLEALVITVVSLKLFPVKRRFDRSTAAKLLEYGIPSGLGAVPQFLNLRLDQMLIAGFLSPIQLGLYVVAVSWSGLSGMPLAAVGPVLFQRMAAEPDVAHARVMFGQASRAALLVAGGTAVAFACVTPALIAILYGKEFRSCVPVALILVAANAIAMTNNVLEEGLRGFGDPRAIVRAELLGLGATVGSMVILMGPLGIIGAATASAVGYVAVTAGLAASLIRHEVTLRDAFCPRTADAVRIFTTVRNTWLFYWRRNGQPATQPST
jgi:O-antigen/teichoic acid export membrane protein